MKCYAAWTDAPSPQRMDKSARDLGGLNVETSVLTAHPTSDVLVIGDMAGGITLFDPLQCEILNCLKEHQQSVSRILFTSDGDYMISASTDGMVLVWDGAGEIVHRTQLTTGVLAAAVHPTTRHVALGGMDKRVAIWEPFNGGAINNLPDQTAPSTSCCWLADGLLAVGDLAGAVWIWEPAQLRLVKRMKAHDQPINHIIVSKKMDWFATSSWDGSVKIWTRSYRERSNFKREGQQPAAIAPTRDEALMAVAYFDGGMRVWNLKNGQLTDEFSASDQPMASCAATVDGTAIVTADNAGGLKSWSIGAVGATRYVHRHAGEVYAVAYTRDNMHLLSVGWDGCLKMWDRQNASELGYIHVTDKPATALDVASDNSFWAIGSADGSVRVWDVAQQQFDSILQTHKLSISGLKLLNGNDRILASSWDNRLSITAVKAQYVDRWFDGHSKEATSCDVSIDGRLMASASRDGTMRIYKLDDPAEFARPVLVLNPHAGSVYACAFSPDGRTVVGAYADHAVRVWSAERPSEPLILEGHQDEATACKFTPDGKLLITADRSGLVCFWDVETAAPLGTLLHDGPVLCLAVSPDGTQAAIGDSAGFVRFMDLEYPTDPLWITATLEHRPPSLWRLGSPAVETWRASCIYCGVSELVDKSRLGKRWRCPKCKAEMQVCPKAASAMAHA
jgi:WD40 repeat protein